MPAFSALTMIVRRAGHHPQHLETQGRHHRALGPQHHRHPPDDAVALGLDREQAAPGGRLFQNATLRSRPVKSNMKGLGSSPSMRHAR